MSHVVKMDLEFTDLDELRAAVESIPELEWRENQKTYKWWGHSVGDYPIPQGVKEEDLGKCDHAIAVKGKKNAYEVGVVAKADGSGYHLIYDFYGGGQGLVEAIGKDACKVKQAYAEKVVLKAARAKGFKLVHQQTTAEGKVQLHLRG